MKRSRAAIVIALMGLIMLLCGCSGDSKKGETTRIDTTTTAVVTTLPTVDGVTIPQEEYDLLVEGAKDFGIDKYEFIYTEEVPDGVLVVPTQKLYDKEQELELLAQVGIDTCGDEEKLGNRQAWKIDKSENAKMLPTIWRYTSCLGEGSKIVTSYDDMFLGAGKVWKLVPIS